jgi:hypothetical protein
MVVTQNSRASFHEVRLQDGNLIDCSRSAVFAQWRGLGIRSLAPRMNACPLPPDVSAHMAYMGGFKSGTVPENPPFRFPELSLSV